MRARRGTLALALLALLAMLLAVHTHAVVEYPQADDDADALSEDPFATTNDEDLAVGDEEPMDAAADPQLDDTDSLPFAQQRLNDLVTSCPDHDPGCHAAAQVTPREIKKHCKTVGKSERFRQCATPACIQIQTLCKNGIETVTVHVPVVHNCTAQTKKETCCARPEQTCCTQCGDKLDVTVEQDSKGNVKGTTVQKHVKGGGGAIIGSTITPVPTAPSSPPVKKAVVPAVTPKPTTTTGGASSSGSPSPSTPPTPPTPPPVIVTVDHTTRIVTIKHSNGTTVRTHPDGSVETKATPTSDAVTIHPNGETSVKKVDGTEIVHQVGGTTVVKHLDGTTVSSSNDGRVVTKKPDGSVETANHGVKTTVHPNGAVTVHMPLGETVTKHTDGTKIIHSTNGTITTVTPDHKIVKQDADGTITEHLANGTKSVHTPKSDGVTTTTPSGVEVTKHQNGTTLVKTKHSITVTHADGTSVYKNTKTGAIVIKHPDGSSTVQPHPDAPVETHMPDKTTIVKHVDGTIVKTMPTGQVIKTAPTGRVEVTYTNGTHVATGGGLPKQVEKPDGSKQVTHKDGIVVTTQPSGVVVTQKPDGTVVKAVPHGAVETISPDGTKTTAQPNGVKIVRHNGGAVTTVHPDGTQVVKHNDGTKVVVTPEGVKVETKSDGQVTTTHKNGHVVIKEKDGSVSSVHKDGSKVKRSSSGTVTHTNIKTGHVTVLHSNGTAVSTTKNGSVTVTLPSGHSETTTKSGQVTIKHVDGTVVVKSPTGTVTTTKANVVVVQKPSGEVITQDVATGKTTTMHVNGTFVVRTKEGAVTLHPPVQKVYPDGTHSTVFHNGTLLRVAPDGSHTTVEPTGKATTHFSNGTSQIVHASTGAVTVVSPKGIATTSFKNGSVETRKTDGTVETKQKDGSVQIKQADGTVETKQADGTQIVKAADGTVTTTHKNGSVSILPPTPKPVVQRKPHVVVTPSGTTITQFANGTSQVVHKDGTVTKHTSDGTTQTTHPDGTRSVQKPDGTSIIAHPNGTVESVKNTGEIVVKKPNGNMTVKKGGDVIHIRHDGTVTSSFANGTHVVAHPGGASTTIVPGKATIEHAADGTVTTHNAVDGSTLVKKPNGVVTLTHADGVSYVTDPAKNGGKTVVFKPVVHALPDGTQVVKIHNGTVIKTAPDGTVTSSSPDGTTLVTGMPDGSVHKTHKNGTVTSTFSDGHTVTKTLTGTVTTTLKDGTQMINHTNSGVVEVHRPNGDVVVKKLNGLVTHTKPDGTVVAHQPDGTVTTVKTDGTAITRHPDGTHSLAKPKTTLLPDGGHLTQFPNGTHIVEHGDGTVVKHHHDGSTTSVYQNGTSISKKPDGTTVTSSKTGGIVTRTPDGTIKVTHSNGDTTSTFADGSHATTRPDGSVTISSASGTTVTKNTDGSKTQVHKDGSATVTLANGTSTLVKPHVEKLSDNSTLVRSVNGKEVITKKDGTVIVKHPHGPTVVTAPDGAVTTNHRDGTSHTAYTNGTQVVTVPGGLSTVTQRNGSSTVTAPDGDILVHHVNGSTTATKKDGTVTTTHGDGSATVVLKNGTHTSISANGTATTFQPAPKAATVDPTVTTGHGTTTVSFPNGTSTAIDHTGTKTVKKPDGTVTVTDPKNGTVTETKADGTKIVHSSTNGTTVVTHPSGSIVTTNKNGTVVTQHGPDGGVTVQQPDGTTEVKQPDGTIITKKPDGSAVTITKDGSVTNTHTDGTQSTKLANGTTFVVKPSVVAQDGKTTTSMPNGTVSIVHQDGTTVTKQPDGSHVSVFTNGTSVSKTADGKVTTVDATTGTTTVQHPHTGKVTVIHADGTVVEHHSGGSTTMSHANGTIVHSFPDGTETQVNSDGSQVTKKPDGTVVKTHVDGSTSVHAADGSIQHNVPPKVELNRTTGSVVTHFVNGTSVVKHTDGSISTTQPGGSVLTVHPNGDQVHQHADGTIVKRSGATGTVSVVKPNGQTTVKKDDGSNVTTTPSGHTHTNYANGTSVVAKPDGTIVTKDPTTGVTVVKSPDGSSVVHSTNGTVTSTAPNGTTTTHVEAPGTPISIPQFLRVSLHSSNSCNLKAVGRMDFQVQNGHCFHLSHPLLSIAPSILVQCAKHASGSTWTSQTFLSPHCTGTPIVVVPSGNGTDTCHHVLDTIPKVTFSIDCSGSTGPSVVVKKPDGTHVVENATTIGREPTPGVAVVKNVSSSLPPTTPAPKPKPTPKPKQPAPPAAPTPKPKQPPAKHPSPPPPPHNAPFHVNVSTFTDDGCTSDGQFKQLLTDTCVHANLPPSLSGLLSFKIHCASPSSSSGWFLEEYMNKDCSGPPIEVKSGGNALSCHRMLNTTKDALQIDCGAFKTEVKNFTIFGARNRVRTRLFYHNAVCNADSTKHAVTEKVKLNGDCLEYTDKNSEVKGSMRVHCDGVNKTSTWNAQVFLGSKICSGSVYRNITHIQSQDSCVEVIPYASIHASVDCSFLVKGEDPPTPPTNPLPSNEKNNTAPTLPANALRMELFSNLDCLSTPLTSVQGVAGICQDITLPFGKGSALVKCTQPGDSTSSWSMQLYMAGSCAGAHAAQIGGDGNTSCVAPIPGLPYTVHVDCGIAPKLPPANTTSNATTEPAPGGANETASSVSSSSVESSGTPEEPTNGHLGHWPVKARVYTDDVCGAEVKSPDVFFGYTSNKHCVSLPDGLGVTSYSLRIICAEHMNESSWTAEVYETEDCSGRVTNEASSTGNEDCGKAISIPGTHLSTRVSCKVTPPPGWAPPLPYKFEPSKAATPQHYVSTNLFEGSTCAEPVIFSATADHRHCSPIGVAGLVTGAKVQTYGRVVCDKYRDSSSTWRIETFQDSKCSTIMPAETIPVLNGSGMGCATWTIRSHRVSAFVDCGYKTAIAPSHAPAPIEYARLNLSQHVTGAVFLSPGCPTATAPLVSINVTLGMCSKLPAISELPGVDLYMRAQCVAPGNASSAWKASVFSDSRCSKPYLPAVVGQGVDCLETKISGVAGSAYINCAPSVPKKAQPKPPTAHLKLCLTPSDEAALKPLMPLLKHVNKEAYALMSDIPVCKAGEEPCIPAELRTKIPASIVTRLPANVQHILTYPTCPVVKATGVRTKIWNNPTCAGTPNYANASTSGSCNPFQVSTIIPTIQKVAVASVVCDKPGDQASAWSITIFSDDNCKSPMMVVKGAGLDCIVKSHLSAMINCAYAGPLDGSIDLGADDNDAICPDGQDCTDHGLPTLDTQSVFAMQGAPKSVAEGVYRVIG